MEHLVELVLANGERRHLAADGTATVDVVAASIDQARRPAILGGEWVETIEKTLVCLDQVVEAKLIHRSLPKPLADAV